MVNPTETFTFRFDTTLLQNLKLEAERKRTNLNSLVIQILKAHVEWHAKAVMAGYVPLRKDLLRTVADSLTEEQIQNIGRTYSQNLFEATLIITGKTPSSESILELLDKWVKACGFEYNFEVDKEKGHTVYTIHHNIGMSWSRLMARVLEEALSQFTITKPEFVTAANTLFIALKEK